MFNNVVNVILQVSVKQIEDRGVKSGFLTKVGQSVKSWKRRYFIFDGDTLYYFENVSSLRQKGEVSKMIQIYDIIFFYSSLSNKNHIPLIPDSHYISTTHYLPPLFIY